MWPLKILTILTIFVISGYATAPVPLSSAKQTPPSRVLTFQTHDAEHTENIVIIRDTGYAYDGGFMAVRFNGVSATGLDTGEVASFFFKPGEVGISVGHDPMGRGLCSFFYEKGNTFSSETIIKAGEKKVFRIGSTEGHDWAVI